MRPTSQSITSAVKEEVLASEAEQYATETQIGQTISKAVKSDNSPEAKAGRRKLLVRAVFGEFMCTLLFYTPIFGSIMHGYLSGWTGEQIGVFSSFVAGFQGVSICFAFSSISGANFNSAVSFALWITGKLSNRKFCLYFIAQMTASILGMCIVTAMFSGGLEAAYDAVAVVPPNGVNIGKVFATEFFLTFFLVYVIFTVVFEENEKQKQESFSFKQVSLTRGLALYASTPQSKSGFAPFSIGFTIFALALTGGSSGGAFNPGRMLGPAIFSGKWDYLWLYWIAQFLGAACAGLTVHRVHSYGLDSLPSGGGPEASATEEVRRVLEKNARATSAEKNNSKSNRGLITVQEAEKEGAERVNGERNMNPLSASHNEV